MKKGLAKKIAGVIGAAAVVTLFTYGPKYEIDGSTVKDGFTRRNTLVEYKGEDKIRYTASLGDNNIATVVINGKGYDRRDTLGVYQEANKKYHYLLGKIDSTKNANKELRAQKRLERKMERIEKERKEAEKDLWVIRK